MNDKKLVTVMSAGSIRELGGIGGPIMNPCRISIDKVKRMVLAGRKVYEHNPANTDEKVLLTEDNVLANNFSSNSTPVAPTPTPSAAPAPAEAPVEIPDDVDMGEEDEGTTPMEEEVDTDPIDPEGSVQGVVEAPAVENKQQNNKKKGKK